MSYQQDLIKRVTDSNQWPNFKRANFLSELDGFAEDAFLYDSIYGYLAAVLIYHQLSEEVIKLVIENAEFFIQISIFPVQIKFPKNDKMMFGQLLSELEKTVEFEQKEEILNRARELNKIRIQIVHGLTKQTSLEGLAKQAKQVKILFDEIFGLCQEVNGFFYLAFKDFRKDIDWEEYFEEA